ncbi:hypothetical protein JQ621_35045 [Bradyrhizobium manausense]|uniref:hypothetical protein n=1 Tax=Bradyrhizobium manausense TaxID=989370 RepID=UPI001BA8D2B9|nr:hypothetical protein [Bradyrhizobium manausense]MBR1092684.1 hypothetical protein [Bradyrhizobium manausense]
MRKLHWIAALAVALNASISSTASFAISAELAKKCNALKAAAFPPRIPSNPAAGSEKGTGRDEIAFFNKCIANDGKVDTAAPPGPAADDKR